MVSISDVGNSPGSNAVYRSNYFLAGMNQLMYYHLTDGYIVFRVWMIDWQDGRLVAFCPFTLGKTPWKHTQSRYIQIEANFLHNGMLVIRCDDCSSKILPGVK